MKYTDPDGRNARYEIDDVNKTVNIIVEIVIYGNGASDEIAEIYQNGINETWNGHFTTKVGDEDYTVNIAASVGVGEKPDIISKNDSKNYINVDLECTISEVIRRQEGNWRPNGRSGCTLEEDNPAPHEVGHLLGLKDRYHGNRDDEGWEDNIMSCGPNVEQRNIDTIMKYISNPDTLKHGTIIPLPSLDND